MARHNDVDAAAQVLADTDDAAGGLQRGLRVRRGDDKEHVGTASLQVEAGGGDALAGDQDLHRVGLVVELPDRLLAVLRLVFGADTPHVESKHQEEGLHQPLRRGPVTEDDQADVAHLFSDCSNS